jgi:hypothetical protein
MAAAHLSRSRSAIDDGDARGGELPEHRQTGSGNQKTPFALFLAGSWRRVQAGQGLKNDSPFPSSTAEVGFSVADSLPRPRCRAETFAAAVCFPRMEGWIVLAIVVLVPFGIATSTLAAERGRPPLGWFIAGFFLGPIALLTIGFSSRVAGGAYKECVECQEAIFRTATTCPYCRNDLIEAEADEREAMRRERRSALEQEDNP